MQNNRHKLLSEGRVLKIEYKCDSCGNETLFYNDVSVEAKRVFNQKNGKEYIRDKSNLIDNYFQFVKCYKCGSVVDEYIDMAVRT